MGVNQNGLRFFFHCSLRAASKVLKHLFLLFFFFLLSRHLFDIGRGSSLFLEYMALIYV